MKESVLMMMKMKSVMQKGSKGYRVHCRSADSSSWSCPKEKQCGTDKKAVIRGGRITIYELAEIPGIENMKFRKAGRAGR